MIFFGVRLFFEAEPKCGLLIEFVQKSGIPHTPTLQFYAILMRKIIGWNERYCIFQTNPFGAQSPT